MESLSSDPAQTFTLGEGENKVIDLTGSSAKPAAKALAAPAAKAAAKDLSDPANPMTGTISSLMN